MKVAKNSQADDRTKGFKKEIFTVHKNLTKKTQSIHNTAFEMVTVFYKADAQYAAKSSPKTDLYFHHKVNKLE